jgi:hypothetical protein
MEVASRTCLLAPFEAEQRAIERNRRFQIADFDIQTEELRDVSRRAAFRSSRFVFACLFR